MASGIARRGHPGLVERVAAARPERPGWYSWQVHEAASGSRALTPAQIPERSGFAFGIPQQGLNEISAGVGQSTQTDRRSQLAQLYESYLACPWAWACVNAIARTITAGGMVMDWNTDTGEGDQEEPDKPEPVMALERLISWCNARQNIRQLMRGVVVDLLVFGDAFIEVTWWGDTPVALYNLDTPTTTPLADEHGNVTGYVQVTEFGQRAEFETRDVIHISLDAPRSGVFGISPTQASILPITSWLFAAACGKEMARKGLPPNVHVDFPAGMQPAEMNRWKAQYQAQNVGPRNIGVPVMTRGGARIAELQAGKLPDILAYLNQKRDEIIAGYGVPPAKVSIIESGNLGGGTGEEQDKSYKVDVCAPIGELILEAFNFSVTSQGFGIDDWRAKWREVDYRASTVVETIRDQRLRNGAWTLDRYRAEIGEPPVDGGNDAVLVDRQNLVLWADMKAMSAATIAGRGAPAVAAGEQTPGGEPMAAGAQGAPAAQDGQGGKDDEDEEGGQKETLLARQISRYRARVAEALAVMPVTEAGGGKTQCRISAASGKFPASALEWVKEAKWSGPQKVPLSDLNMASRSDWNASGNPGKVRDMASKLHKKQADGGELKPVILVRRPGSDKALIADGHHRTLAYEADGQDYVWAYVGRVDTKTGPWDQLATRQKAKAA